MRALSIHAGYRCRHSGLCCRSGWPIEVGPRAERALRTALGDSRLRPPARPEPLPVSRLLVEEPGLPHGARCRLGQDAQGTCLFFDAEGGNLCAVHRDLGPDSLPAACRHFPRVALLTPNGVSLSLSHYCPTAAALLFDDDATLDIVTNPEAFPADAPYEGLDARDHLPPFLRAGVLLGWPAFERWEAHLVGLFARPDTLPEAAVHRLEALAHRAARWSVDDGPFDPWFESLLAEDAGPATQPPPPPTAQALEGTRLLWAAVLSATAPGLPRPAFPEAFETSWGLVEPVWQRHRRAVNRFLAARGFASWCALQGPGLRTTARALAASLAVLRVECARRAESSETPLDAEELREAIRAADLRLVHYARPERLARALSSAETQPLP